MASLSMESLFILFIGILHLSGKFHTELEICKIQWSTVIHDVFLTLFSVLFETALFSHCSQGRLRYFQYPYFLLWLLFPIFGGLHYTSVCWFLFSVNPTSSEHLRPTILEEFNIPVEQTAYTAAIFWFPNPESNGKGFRFNWTAGVGLINIFFEMGVAFSMIVLFGLKSRKKIKELVQQGESQFTRNLQTQLYKALMAQVGYGFRDGT